MIDPADSTITQGGYSEAVVVDLARYARAAHGRNTLT